MNRFHILGIFMVHCLVTFGQSNTISNYFSKNYESDSYNRVSFGYNFAEKGFKIGYERMMYQTIGIEVGMDFTHLKDMVSGNGPLLEPLDCVSDATLKKDLMTDFYIHFKIYLYDDWRFGFKVAYFPFVHEQFTDVGVLIGYHLPLGNRFFLEPEAGLGIRAYKDTYDFPTFPIRCPVSVKVGYCF